jgi:hypothetical protein
VFAVLLTLSACGGRSVRDLGADAGAIADAGKIEDAGDADETPAAPVCAPFHACGGDLVGRWKVVSDCYDSSDIEYGCETLHHNPDMTAGTFEFSDTGMAIRDVTGTVNYTMLLQGTCVDSSCDALQATVEARIAEEGSGTAVCSSVVGGCSCEIVVTSDSNVSSGYSVVGSRLTYSYDPDPGASETFDFCVDGDTLTLHLPGEGSVTLSRD